jgi:sugar phosphate isomerase/epimerase
MPRPILLFTGPWADLPLEDLAAQAAEWGYQGLDLCCWGDHFELQRALGQEDYATSRLEALRRLDLDVPVLSNHRVGLAVGGPIDHRLRDVLPDYVWGDGDPLGVQQRATEEMIATCQAAQRIGAAVVAGWTGSPLWPWVMTPPVPSPQAVAEGLREFVHRWLPVLDVCRDCGLRFAAEVCPGQIAFDLYSAEAVLDALHGREEFGFSLDPTHLHWQGVDPVEFIRRFGERIYHVQINDLVIALNGRSGLLGSYLPQGDMRRGWQSRCPGRGGLDWESIIRALNAVGYEGVLSVEIDDPGMERGFAAEEACRFVKRLDFEPAPRPDPGGFR